MSSTLKRALFHIFVGLSIALSALFPPRVALLISLGLITFAALFFEALRFRNKRVNKWFLSLLNPLLREYETSRLTGSSYILAASLISFLVFERDIAIDDDYLISRFRVIDTSEGSILSEFTNVFHRDTGEPVCKAESLVLFDEGSFEYFLINELALRTN